MSLPLPRTTLESQSKVVYVAISRLSCYVMHIVESVWQWTIMSLTQLIAPVSTAAVETEAACRIWNDRMESNACGESKSLLDKVPVSRGLRVPP
jgi:hypothetical protein